jgi:hypothetical protein
MDVQQSCDGEEQHLSEEVAPNIHSFIVDLEQAPSYVSFAGIVHSVARLHILVVFVPDGDVREAPVAPWSTFLDKNRLVI